MTNWKPGDAERRQRADSNETVDELIGILKRRESVVENKIFWNILSIADVIKIGAVLFATIIFMINWEARTKMLETNQLIVQKTLDRLVDFTENSDSFNTLNYGTRFRNGYPIDGNFKGGNKGNLKSE